MTAVSQITPRPSGRSENHASLPCAIEQKRAPVAGSHEPGRRDVHQPVTTLLNPLQLPRRLLKVTEATVAAVQLLPDLPALVIARLNSLERGVQQVVSVLPELMAEIDRVEATLEPQAERVGRIEAAVERMEERMEALLSEVQDASEHLPNHGADGPIDRMRDALKSQT